MATRKTAAGKVVPTPVTKASAKTAVSKSAAKTPAAKKAPGESSTARDRSTSGPRPVSVITVSGYAVVMKRGALTPVEVEKLRRAIALLKELAVITACERPSD